MFEISSLEKSFNLLEYETKSHLSLSRTTSLCHSSESFSSISVSEIDDVEDIKSYHIPNEAVSSIFYLFIYLFLMSLIYFISFFSK